MPMVITDTTGSQRLKRALTTCRRPFSIISPQLGRSLSLANLKPKTDLRISFAPESMEGSEGVDFFAEFMGKAEGTGQTQTTDLRLSSDGLSGHAVLYLEHASSTTSIYLTVSYSIIYGDGSQHSLYFHTLPLWKRTSRVKSPFSMSGVYNISISLPLSSLPFGHLLSVLDDPRISLRTSYNASFHIFHTRWKAETLVRFPIRQSPPSSPALPMSAMRRKAYLDKTPLKSPIREASSWDFLSTCMVKGMFCPPSSRKAGATPITIATTLYISAPLSFHTKGVIPCYLTLESHSAAGLEVLANPECQRIRLRRQVTYFQPAGTGVATGNRSNSNLLPQEEQRPPLDSSASPLENVRVRGTDGYLRTISTEEVIASWWLPPHNVAQEDTLRRLEGEIWLPDTLQPSCETDYLRIEYFVEVLFPASLSFGPQQTSTDSQSSSSLKRRLPPIPHHPDKPYASKLVHIASSPAQDDPSSIPSRFLRPAPPPAPAVYVQSSSPISPSSSTFSGRCRRRQTLQVVNI